MARPSGDPFQDLCTAIGLMTLTWAWAETNLALTIGVINKEAGPIKGHAQPPLSLKNRVAAFRVALRDITMLHPVQDEGRRLAERFTYLSRRRNDLIHGAAWQFHEGDVESFGIGLAAGQYAITEHRFNQADAVGLTTEIAKLQDDAQATLFAVIALLRG